jgi:hypothetical protein
MINLLIILKNNGTKCDHIELVPPVQMLSNHLTLLYQRFYPMRWKNKNKKLVQKVLLEQYTSSTK